MKNEISFKLLVAVILSGLLFAWANATVPAPPAARSLQASASAAAGTPPAAAAAARS